MKKLLILSIAFALGTSVSNYAQHSEVAPAINSGYGVESTNALFDQQFNTDIGQEIGTNGNAGVLFFGGQYWISAWASAEIHVLNSDREYEESFTIAGITGARSFTTDGTNVYVGTASNKIFVVDPATRSLTSTITIAGGAARMLTYDTNLDGGAGGFWTGSFSDDIKAFSKTGTLLTTIPANVFSAAVYGGAVEVAGSASTLWIFDQGVGGGESLVRQLALPSGTPTGVVYNYNTSGQQPAGNTSIAGGLFISGGIVPGTISMIGVGQGTPSDQLFGVELSETAGISDSKINGFNLFPNPVSGGILNIETTTPGEKNVVIFDVLGKQVMNVTIAGKELNVSSLRSGLYMVSVTQNKSTVTKKLVVQ